MRKTLLFLAAVIFLSAACSGDPDILPDTDPDPDPDPPPTEVKADPDFHIYLCFGQSNMEGNAAIEEVDKTDVDPRFKVMAVSEGDAQHLGRTPGKWYRAVPPLCRWDTGLSPADYFGRTMAAALPEKNTVGVIMVAMGGSGIDAFDKDNYREYYNNADDWQRGLMDIYGGNPYARMVQLAKAAQKEGVIKGILLHQGETNNMQQDWPDKVKKIYGDLLKDLDLKAEQTPLLAGELLYEEQGGYCWGMNDIIAELPSVIGNAHVISAEGCTGSDGLHFTADGYRTLGRRYANRMLSILGEPIPPQPGPRLRVDGRYLRDPSGKIVNLHGFAQTYSPFFNNNAWGNYDVNGCLRYNKGLIDRILGAGWAMNFVRMHMDPYWSSDPDCLHTDHEWRYEGHECFSEQRFRTYLDQVFVPMAEYAISKGLYVVFRPPGVSPERIAVGDDYNTFLELVWSIVSAHPKIANNPNIMFELANEPIDILGPDGTYASAGDGHFANTKRFFQTVVDVIRLNADNIIWVPGLGYQSSYSGFANHRIEGTDIGYAVHVYPGWFNSGQGYEPFQRGWDDQVKPVADFAPIMVTEMDWAPEKYNSSWGKDITGTAGGDGFGANFKYITDNSGNVSWLIFTDAHLLADFVDEPGTPGSYTFLNDPEACPWPTYHWYKEYAGETSADKPLMRIELLEGGYPVSNMVMLTGSSKSLIVRATFTDGSTQLVTVSAYFSSSDPGVVSVDGGRIDAFRDGSATITVSYMGPLGDTEQAMVTVNSMTFPLTGELFNPSIWENGSFDEQTRTLVTGQYGFGGWYYNNGVDLSGYKYLVAELGNDNDSAVSFRLFDENSYWSGAAEYDFGDTRRVVVELDNMYKNVNGSPVKLDPRHIYYVGFWSLGFSPIIIENVYLTDTVPY